MAGGGKKGALGLAAVAGIFGLRFADNCGSLAARGARLGGDDLVRAGARSGDELLGAGARGADGALGGAGRVRWGPSVGLDAAGHVPAASGDELVQTLAEGGVDIAIEVLNYEAPETSGEVETPRGVACPVPHDLTLDPQDWTRYLDGLGIACAPAVFIGRASGLAMEADGAMTRVEDLARSCAAAGGVCFFIGCTGQGRCFREARRAALGIRGTRELQPYMLSLAQRQLSEVDVAWVAFSEDSGTLSLLRPQHPPAVRQAPSRAKIDG